MRIKPLSTQKLSSPFLGKLSRTADTLPPLACSLLQIDSQMESLCEISFRFVDPDQLVSCGCLQGLCVLSGLGICESMKAAEIPELGRVWV